MHMARSYHRSVTTPAAARTSRPGARSFVSLLTDFGTRDPSAGIMRSVVLGIAPEAAVVDISHDVRKYAVRDGALVLWCAIPYMPIGAHVAVVDPGVGTERRPIAIETLRGDYLVGPDNGLLLPAAARLGGVTRVHALENPQYRLPVVSSSFHGRDVFAPAAAHLSLGVPLEFMGPAIDPRGLVLLDWPEPDVYDGLLRATVIYLDTFGNVKLSALGGHLINAFPGIGPGDRLWLRIEDASGSRDVAVPWVGTFGHVPVGSPLIFDDSYGRLCIAVNQGSAVQLLGLTENANVTLTRSPLPRGAAVVAPVPVAEVVPAPVPAPAVEPSEPDPEPEPPPVPEPKPDPVPKPEPKPEPKSKPKPPPDPEPKPKPEPEPKPKPPPDPEPVLESEQAPVEGSSTRS